MKNIHRWRHLIYSLGPIYSIIDPKVQDFILFEYRLDNSLQRDLTKMEHVRTRLTHEPAVPETIDLELLEFKFIYDRSAHFV